ncbi:MAG TPA: PIN domain nuclease [Treponema sp.]|nr:PIN domain nuclease [Treponema sp.]
MVYADTNILIRFIVKDNMEMALAAKSAILSGEMFVSTEVFAEVTYVLHKVYGIERGRISQILSLLLDLVATNDSDVMRHAFSYYAQTKLDFVDCILAAQHTVNGVEIISFDKRLTNFIHRMDS